MHLLRAHLEMDNSIARRLYHRLPDPIRRRVGGLRQLLHGKRQPQGRDSISGYFGAYTRLCRLATTDPNCFENFRASPDYTPILEHVTDAQGRAYLGCLSLHGRAHAGLKEASKNDAIGGPNLMQLDGGLKIAPTTLRYLKVADDIEKSFATLDGGDVIEIGVGYGGQCRIIDALFQIKSYTLVDLQPVLDLAAVFLGHFALRTSVRFITMNELAPRSYDFALSNYAFTELPRDIQETYFRKVLSGATRGYITYNDIAPPEYRSMTRAELCERLNGTEMPEIPLTHARNCIIAWGLNEVAGSKKSRTNSQG
jgi:putative sugar O-methyltransferase